MKYINEILETAHISISTASLKVVVNDLNKYKVLFWPRCTHIEDNIYEEDPEWKKEMNFPLFVLSVTPWFDDGTLSVFVEHPFDIKELSDWLKTFE
jgi:hypothetical protein